MSFPALLAAEAAMGAQAPWWWSAASALLGTVIGGGITFLTTRSANDAKEKAERQRQRNERIADLSTRFIQAVSKRAVATMRIEESMAEVEALMKQAIESGDPAQALRALADVTEFDLASFVAKMDLNAQVKMATEILRGLGGSESTLSESGVLLAEMRLVLPPKVVHTAEQVSSIAFGFSHMGSGMPLPARIQISTQIINALNVFVNEVRRETGLDVYIPTDTNIQVAAQRIEELAKQQKQQRKS